MIIMDLQLLNKENDEEYVVYREKDNKRKTTGVLHIHHLLKNLR